MIRERRRAHLRAFQLLSVALPVFIALAYFHRPEFPIRGGLPEDLAARAGLLANSEALRMIQNREQMEVRLESFPDGPVLFVRSLLSDLHPEVLLYFEKPGGERSDLVLIGKISNDVVRAYSFPAELTALDGHFVLYSLPRGEVIDRIPTTPLGRMQ